MGNLKIVNEDDLLNRRYPSVVKSRKEWICNGCGNSVPKGEVVEHSYSADRNDCYALCLHCSAKLKPNS